MSSIRRCSWTTLPVVSAGFVGLAACEQAAPSDAKQRAAKTLCACGCTSDERKPNRMKETINLKLIMGS